MAIQRQKWETVIRLSFSGLPILGALPSDVTLKYCRFEATAFVTKSLTVDTWRELSDGFYVITWTPDEMEILGPFTMCVTGVLFDQIVESFIVETAPPGSFRPELCTIRGNVADLGGNPVINEEVTFKLAKTPASTPTSILSGGYIRTTADIFGNFSVVLTKGATVIVEIPQCGLKATFIVPDNDEANLIDIIPPIP